MAMATVKVLVMVTVTAKALAMCANGKGNGYGDGYGDSKGNDSALFFGSGCIVVHDVIICSRCMQHPHDTCLCSKVPAKMPL